MDEPVELVYYREKVKQDQSFSLKIKVMTNCPEAGIKGQLANGTWKIGVPAIAQRGEANKFLLQWLAGVLGCKIYQLKIIAGQHTSHKIVQFIP